MLSSSSISSSHASCAPPVSVFNIKCFKRRKWDSLIFTDVTILYLISIFKRYDNLSNTRKWTGFVSLVGYFFIVIHAYILCTAFRFFLNMFQYIVGITFKQYVG